MFLYLAYLDIIMCHISVYKNINTAVFIALANQNTTHLCLPRTGKLTLRPSEKRSWITYRLSKVKGLTLSSLDTKTRVR